MQDNLPDIPRSVNPNVAEPKQKKPGLFTDDKRLVKIILLVSFGLLLILGIAAAVLEQVAPRGIRPSSAPEAFSTGLWQIRAQPNQIILGFFEDSNQNNQFDYREKPFAKVSVAIRRAGETEPFRRVSASVDGLVKIDDLNLGDYEISYDNYSPAEAGDWLFFEEYQQGEEFLPTAWRRVSLTSQGYKELTGILPYQPPLLLALMTDSGLTWYDPERARIYGKSNLVIDVPVARGRDIYYLQDGKLKKLDWTYRTVSEELTWLEAATAGNWWLSPQGKTVAYLSDQEFRFRSQIEACSEGGLLVEGERPPVKLAAFFSETSMLAAGEKLYKVDCQQVEPVETAGKVESLGVLAGGWFYSTVDSTYLVWENKTVKYAALGGGKDISASPDGRYLVKPISQTSWLVVDWPAVQSSGVEKHYLLTGITGEPTIIDDEVYFVRAKACQADGDCGEVVRIKLAGSGSWSVDATWDLKNVAATKVLGVVE